METPKIFDSELRFCEILWSHEPVKSSELVRLCAEELGWKKSTTYTVIKRLAERGVVHTENAVVTSRVAREDVQRAESRAFVAHNFHPVCVVAGISDGFHGKFKTFQRGCRCAPCHDRPLRAGEFRT